jgi:hypothetical protein
MLSALIALAVPGALAGWSRVSGRRLVPAVVLLVVAVAMIGQLPWLVLGCTVAAGTLATRRLWIDRWVRATPFLRGWRVRRWAKVGWDAAASAVGLGAVSAPVAPLTITSVGDRIHALWTLPLGCTFTHVDRERTALAAFFDAPRLDVKPIRPSVVSLVWRWDEPLAASRVADPPTPGTVCLADGLLVGRDEAGADVRWQPLAPASSALVVGGTRSGKSNTSDGGSGGTTQ